MKKFTVVDALGQLQMFNGDFSKDAKGKDKVPACYRLEPRGSFTVEADSEEKLPHEILLAKKQGFVYVFDSEQVSSKKSAAKDEKEAKQ